MVAKKHEKVHKFNFIDILGHIIQLSFIEILVNIPISTLSPIESLIIKFFPIIFSLIALNQELNIVINIGAFQGNHMYLH